jgi:WD40 repeat protein
MGAVNSVRFSPDGARLVTASADGTAQLWDARSGASLLILGGHTGAVNEAAFSPDGKLVITAGEDGTVRMWETISGNKIALLADHTGSVQSVAFSPDGTRAVTAGADRTARIYRWEFFAPVDDVIARARTLVTRGLTCAQQQQYLHTSMCAPPVPATHILVPGVSSTSSDGERSR